VKLYDKDLLLHRAFNCVAAVRYRDQAQSPDEPYNFFREFAGLNEEQIATIR